MDYKRDLLYQPKYPYLCLTYSRTTNTLTLFTMNPPFFGYFDMDLKSVAKTFDECLQERNGDLESFGPIEEFIEFFHDYDNCDAFLEGENFNFFCPENEEHHFYVFCGDGDDIFTLSDGKQYRCLEFSDCISPVTENEEDYDYDVPEIRLADVIEEEYEHLSVEYGHLFKKFTIEEFQEYWSNELYPWTICAK